MEMYDTVTDVQPQVVAGDLEAGQSVKVVKQLKALIKNLSVSTFDLMDLLYEIKTKKFYTPKFNTFSEFAKSLDGLKTTKAYYLVKIKEVMTAADYTREQYEPVGMAKLRWLSRLTTESPTEIAIVKALFEKAPALSVTELKNEVAVAQGLTGDDALVWLNVPMKKGARDVIQQAITVAKYQIGSVTKDEEGMSQDASDGSALERVAQDFLSDPANKGPEEFDAQDDSPSQTL